MVINKNIIKNRKGQAAIEFALCLPVLLFMLFAMLDFGQIMVSTLDASIAARKAVDIAIVDGIPKGVIVGNNYIKNESFGKYAQSLGKVSCEKSSNTIGSAVICKAEIPLHIFNPANFKANSSVFTIRRFAKSMQENASFN